MARVYQTSTMGEAHVRVALVAERGAADLWVHRVSSFGLADGDGLWFITRDQQEATVWVSFTSLGMEEVKIFFVDNYGEAGWRNPGRYVGRFGR